MKIQSIGCNAENVVKSRS